MSVPFDTLQLARGFEAAGFPLDQASKMAEAVANLSLFSKAVLPRIQDLGA